jgi:hypothetical protein
MKTLKTLAAGVLDSWVSAEWAAMLGSLVLRLLVGLIVSSLR